MLQLTINGLEVKLADGAKFTIKRENPLLTDGGDYSLTVNVPLNGDNYDNRRIFGLAHRTETPKLPLAGVRYDFNLVAPPLSLSGYAVLQEVTNTEARLQLKAGRSGLDAAAKDKNGNELYIDELDLGRAYEKQFREVYGEYETQTMKKTMLMMFRDDLSTPAQTLQYGSFNDTECVTLPIWSTEGDGRWANERNLLQYYDSINYIGDVHKNTLPKKAKLQKQWYGMQIDYLCTVRPDQSDQVTFKTGQVLAPQPYMGFIIKRIVEALGYELADADNALKDPRNWLSNVFIANARGDINFAHILPHWTVSQFFEEVQRFFGVVITADSSTRRAMVINKRDIYKAAAAVEIENPVDDFTTTTDGDAEQVDPAAGTVKYALPDTGGITLISDDLWAVAIHQVLESEADIAGVKAEEQALAAAVASGNTQGEDDLNRIHGTIYHYKPDGRSFAFVYPLNADGTRNETKVVLARVDHYSPASSEDDGWNRDTDIELKIVPVRLFKTTDGIGNGVTRQVWGWYDGSNFIGGPTKRYEYVLKLEQTFSFYAMKTSDTRASSGYDPQPIAACLKPEDPITPDSVSKRDVIEVGYYGGIELQEGLTYTEPDGKTSYFAIPMPTGLPFDNSNEEVGTGELLPICPGIFALNDHDSTGFDGMLQQVLRSYKPADMRAEMKLSFISSKQLDPIALYIINGRRYICKQLEYTVTSEGCSRLVNGTFCELAD